MAHQPARCQMHITGETNNAMLECQLYRRGPTGQRAPGRTRQIDATIRHEPLRATEGVYGSWRKPGGAAQQRGRSGLGTARPIRAQGVIHIHTFQVQAGFGWSRPIRGWQTPQRGIHDATRPAAPGVGIWARPHRMRRGRRRGPSIRRARKYIAREATGRKRSTWIHSRNRLQQQQAPTPGYAQRRLVTMRTLLRLRHPGALVKHRMPSAPSCRACN